MYANHRPSCCPMEPSPRPRAFRVCRRSFSGFSAGAGVAAFICSCDTSLPPLGLLFHFSLLLLVPLPPFPLLFLRLCVLPRGECTRFAEPRTRLPTCRRFLQLPAAPTADGSNPLNHHRRECVGKESIEFTQRVSSRQSHGFRGGNRVLDIDRKFRL